MGLLSCGANFFAPTWRQMVGAAAPRLLLDEQAVDADRRWKPPPR